MGGEVYKTMGRTVVERQRGEHRRGRDADAEAEARASEQKWGKRLGGQSRRLMKGIGGAGVGLGRAASDDLIQAGEAQGAGSQPGAAAEPRAATPPAADQ